MPYQVHPVPRPLHQVAQTQPTLFSLTLKGLLTLPYRLCNPPPAVGKVRSCGVTPVFKVQLEDVLNRKHLPPLGLKDFEEWLLFVERCPENLYFILWLREYNQKYKQWAIRSKSKPKHHIQGTYRLSWPAHTSPSLAMSYARAKQTFFTPNSAYELSIPSDILTPFHTTNFGSPHPDPEVFTEVESQVTSMLKDSLSRFVTAAYPNVGTARATCGIVGGSAFTLIGAVPPLVVNFVNQHSRWLRLLAVPGLWLGLAIVITSLHGVCMMIYVFGDLRQLRKFELARPPISTPKPVQQMLLVDGSASSSSSGSGASSDSVSSPAAVTSRPSRITPPRALTAPPRITVSIPERAYHRNATTAERISKRTSMASVYSTASTSCSSSQTRDSSASMGSDAFPPHPRPHLSSSDGSSYSGEDDGDYSGEDGEEDSDENGIYVSPAYHPDEDVMDMDGVMMTTMTTTPGDTPLQTPTFNTGFNGLQMAHNSAGESSHPGVVAAVAAAAAGGQGGGFEKGMGGITGGGGCECCDKALAVLASATAGFIRPYDYPADPDVLEDDLRRVTDAGAGAGERDGLDGCERGEKAGVGVGLDMEMEEVGLGVSMPMGRTGKQHQHQSQGVGPFDFDKLPPPTVWQEDPLLPSAHRKHHARSRASHTGTGDGDRSEDMETPMSPVLSPTKTPFLFRLKQSLVGGAGADAIGRRQDKCLGADREAPGPALSADEKAIAEEVLPAQTGSIGDVKAGHLYSASHSPPQSKSKSQLPQSTTTPTSQPPPRPISPSSIPPSDRWRIRFRALQRVPAFGPVTRILNPVVTRAQWEIVVRSFVISALVSCVIGVVLVSLPVVC